MWFQVEEGALTDERIQLLGVRLGLSHGDAFLATCRVWRWLYKQGGRDMTVEEVTVVSQVQGFAEAMEAHQLADYTLEGLLRIRGCGRAQKYGAFCERQKHRRAQRKAPNEMVITNDQPAVEPTVLPKRGLISSESSSRVSSSPESIALGQYLLDAIQVHTPGHKGNPERWARDIDLAIRIDGLSPEDLRSVIDYAHRDPDGAFWASNLLSGAKLRKHAARLLIALRKAPRSAVAGGNEGGRVMTADELAEWAAEEMARERERGER